MCGVGVLLDSSKNTGKGLENTEDKDYPNTERKNGGGIRYRNASVAGRAACLKPPNEVVLQGTSLALSLRGQ